MVVMVVVRCCCVGRRDDILSVVLVSFSVWTLEGGESEPRKGRSA